MSHASRSVTMTGGARRRRPGLLRTLTAIFAILATTENAMAGMPLRRMVRAARGPVDPAAAAAAAAAAQAAAAQRQAQTSLRRALQSLKGFQGVQSAARSAAQAGESPVPNGITPGGLAVLPGALPEPTCGGGTGLWCGADLPSQTIDGGRTAVTIVQNESKSILTWESFNVGRETDLRFDQSRGGNAASSWVALNRVLDPNAAPSKILGSIRAEGQVYVINRNGIVFGGASQVNVASLVASGLDFAGATTDARNQVFLRGIAQGGMPDQPVPIFAGGGGAVTVEAGAQLGAASYGQVFLVGGAAGGVVNGGTLTAPDGQVILVAGDGVSLARGSDNRGFALPEVSEGGTVTNTGIVSTPRGNITSAGKELRQLGLFTATTSAKAAGSIVIGNDRAPVPLVTFGEGSVTQILPDPEEGAVTGKSALDAPSRIAVAGRRISVLDGATLYAPAGEITLSASILRAEPGTSDDTRIYIGSGARVDVSGLLDVKVAMEQNTVEAELRAAELRDNPVLRGSPLRGRKVYFDARRGVEIADLSGYADLVPRTVEQFMTKGGTVRLVANEIIAREGSVIDLSGGSIRYRDGWVRSTYLIDATGNRVRIEDAKAGVPYVAIDGGFVVNHARWGKTETFTSPLSRSRPRFERGYVDGGSAGTLEVSTNDSVVIVTPRDSFPLQVNEAATGAFRIFDGKVVATTVAGPRQSGAPPSGATLVFDRSGDVTIAGGGPRLDPGFSKDGTLDLERWRHVLPASWFDGHTFTKVSITSGYWDDSALDHPPVSNLAPGGHLTIGQGLVVDLGTQGSFSFVGKQADIDGTLLAPGGSVSLRTLQLEQGKTWSELGPDERPRIRLGANGAIDVAGRWSNVHLDGAGAPLGALDGGSVTLIGTDVILAKGSLVDAGGGARLDATGTKLTAGKGGRITIDVSRPNEPAPPQREPFDGRLVLDGTLRGYAAGTGGTLTLVTPYDIVIGDALPDGAGASARLFTPDFFTRGGFSAYALVGERSVTLRSGTVLAPSVDTLALGAHPETPSGKPILDLATRYVLREPDGRGLPMSLSLSTVPVRSIPDSGAEGAMDLVVERGARVEMAPGSTVRLAATGTVDVDGRVEALGGSIELKGDGLGLSSRLGSAAVHLGADARLVAAGYEKVTRERIQDRRSVEAGGTVAISGNDVQIDPTAVVDVSGTAGVADLVSGLAGEGESPYEARTVFSDAGSITISAPSGRIAGVLRLAPGGDGAAGGTLSIGASVAGTMSSAGGAIVVYQGTAAPVADANALAVSADRIDESGADALALGTPSGRAILFDGDVALRTRRSIRLLSPVVGMTSGAPGSVTLESGYVQLAGASSTGVADAHPAALEGDLTVHADLIDLTGAVTLGSSAATAAASGFRTARFVASGDIRLSDHDASGIISTTPGLFSDGALDFESAQLYVSSRLQSLLVTGLERPDADPGFLVRSNVSITVTGNGRPAPLPLSFGERLTLRAPAIVQGGVLRAPQGQIRLEGRAPDGTATGSVTLLPGSVTSASLEGNTIPFGQVRIGGAFAGYDTAGQAPTKSVKLDAPDVDVRRGATIDLSGGGDLSGYAFVPGNGGSSDVLSSPDAFAILPSLGAGPAPVGGVPALMDRKLEVGAAVWLHGVPGLADGFYTLLPAHYALLPGGLLIQPAGGSSQGALAAPPETFTRSDGAVVAAGYLGWQTSDGAAVRARGYPGWGRFTLMSHEVFSQYSELVTYFFDEYARGLAADAGLVARTPNDAGSAIVSASRSLVLEGTGRFAPGPGGLLGNLDISAEKIAVVGDGRADPGTGYLTLDPRALVEFGAGSVLLGGTRSATASGTAVTVNATDVVVDTGAASPWIGQEIILAARGSVSIADGSVIGADGDVSRDANPLLLSGDGALLRLSTGERVSVVRSGGGVGDLRVGDATLSSAGSLTLEGSRAVNLSPAAVLSATQIDVASTRVNLGAVPSGTDGTTLGADAIDRLSASAADLLIRGHEAIHLYGDMQLGGRDGTGAATLRQLTFDTGLLQGHDVGGGPAASRITAGELTLRNGGGAAAATAGGAGTLTLDADTLRLGPGGVTVAGYGALGGTAGVLEAQGSGRLGFAGDLSLAVGQVRATSGAMYTVDAGGAVALTGGGVEALPDGTGFGGRLAIAGTSVLLDTGVVLPAGTFEATARSGTLALGEHAAIDVGGRAVPFDEQVRYAPGGAVRLEATQGDLAVAAGATLDVSAAADGGDAGRIELTAAGQASVQGTLLGRSAAVSRGGAFALDAATADFTALNAILEAGGFTAERTIRLRQQDVVLGAGEAIRAHEVTLRSDAGQVRVGGEIAAAGDGAQPGGGTIRLVGGAGVRVEGAARLDAHAAAAGADGFDPASGKVELVAEGGTVDVASGAVLDVSGGTSAGGAALAGGSVVVRAPRGFGGNPNDVAIVELAGELRGAREIVVQGVERYEATAVDAALIGDATLPGTLLGDAAAWLRDSAAGIRARLAVPALQIGPGIEVTSAGDLAIEAPIDLHAIAAPGYLGFVARGDLVVDAAVSSGFDGTSRAANLLADPSFGYRFESGGDLTLSPGAMIRTGTGDVWIEAGRDLVLSDPKESADLNVSQLPPPVIYTAGRRTDPAPGFLGAPPGMPLGEFPTDGGDLVLRAGRDVVAPTPRQTTSAWLFRDGASSWGDASTPGDTSTATIAQQTSWSVVYRNFEQGVGALGGGDVQVRAGRNVEQLQVSIPTTGHLTTEIGAVPNPEELVVRGGGDLDLEAGGDVLGGLFMLGRGHAEIRAGGSVVGAPGGSGALFGLMDATARVTAISTVDVEAAFDPMRQGQIAENLENGTAGSGFWGYTDRTSLDATSLAGDVKYENDPLATIRVTDHANQADPRYEVTMSGTSETSLDYMFTRAPPTLRFTSFESSVVLGNVRGSLLLAPAGRGTLEALARRDVIIPLLLLQLEDIAPIYARGPLDPFSTDFDGNKHVANVGNWLNSPATNSLRGFTPIHSGDPDPVRLYAMEGSVCAYQSGSCAPSANISLARARITTPKPIDVLAGRDVVVGDYQPQNNGPGDLSAVRAGRDVYDVTLQVGGTGVAVMEAGRDVVEHLQNETGVQSLAGGLVYGKGDGSKTAATTNPALPHLEGPSLLVIAGAKGMDLDAFAAAYLDPANRQGVVTTYLTELAAYMAALGFGPMDPDTLVAAFRALPRTRREHFLLDQVYFAELEKTGIDYNDPAGQRYHSYDRGFRAVSLLFPEGGAPVNGDVILSGKPLETWAQGDIAVVAPHGRVAVGSELYDTSSGGGIVTRRGGDVRIMADGNIDLFTSRVFTLQGGDITMWTSNGSITAGAGSKTSVLDVPLTYTMSNDAVVTVNVFGLQTGAGIGVLDALQDAGDRTPSRLDLIAPRGEVNAGDAGIRVVGNLNIAAAVVVGMENIQASGASVGVPKVEVPSVGALTTASQLTQAAAKEGVGPPPQAKNPVAELPSIITVEVVGYETPDTPAQREEEQRRRDRSKGKGR